MTTTLPARSGSLGAMARMEARRFARHPLFLVGVVLAYGIPVVLMVTDSTPQSSDLMSWPVIPAFFIGLTSLVVAARLTRSTEVAAEAFGAAPGTESQRTLAVAMACLVPFTAGLAWLALPLGQAAIHEPIAQEWWFHNLSDVYVWAALVSLAPVACLGGALLGVLVGRWLSFPGAAAVAVVVVVAACIAGEFPADTESATLRLGAPWVLWHSGTFPDGTQVIYAGNPVAHLGYLLSLCTAAVLGAVWHDPTARTARLRAVFAGVVVVGLACLTLAMTTGIEDSLVSDPIPYMVED